MNGTSYPVGTELKTAHGNRFVKVADDVWRVRGDWGVLDEWTLYTDKDVFGEVVATGVKK